MRLFILVLALFVTESCNSGENASNGRDSIAPPASQGERLAVTQTKPNERCLNLNIATEDELIKLPGVGEAIAKRIVDYRARNGRFRRPEEIIIIEGFSENKYRAIASMICVE